MSDGLLMLVFLCALMAAASFGAGILPLTLSLTSRQLRLVTALGTGILVGTALVVIIPEGIETLYNAGSGSHAHSHAKRDVLGTVPAIDTSPNMLPLEEGLWRREVAHDERDGTDMKDADLGFATGPDDRSGHSDGSNTFHNKEGDDSEGEENDHDPHSWIGLSLITGFLLMYLIDTLPRHMSGPSKPERLNISLGQFSFTRPTFSTSNSAPPSVTVNNDFSAPATPRPSPTTLGLIIHATADGIALGASSSSPSSGEKNSLSFFIFLALMFHKAPAAFGLTTTLLKQNLSTRAARAHLIAFSLAAPAGALATWAVAHMIGFAGDTAFATGVLLLFSGGTFLYVAVHAMHEGTSDQNHEHNASDTTGSNGFLQVPGEEAYGSSSPSGQHQSDSKREGLLETGVSALGMLLPLVLGIGHHH